jgi:hypothetical protein
VALNYTECGLNSSGSVKRPVAGSCEHYFELLFSMKCGGIEGVLTCQQEVSSSVRLGNFINSYKIQ